MGDTHFRSNIKAATPRGLEISGWSDMKCATLSATRGTIPTLNVTNGNFTTTASINAAGGLRANRPNFSRGTSVQLNTDLFMIWGTAVTVATMEAAATALCTGTPDPGSMYLCTHEASGGLFVRGSAAASWGKIALGV